MEAPEALAPLEASAADASEAPLVNVCLKGGIVSAAECHAPAAIYKKSQNFLIFLTKKYFN